MRTTVLPDLVTDPSQNRTKAYLERLGAKEKAQLQKDELREATREFEAVMVEMMVKEMRKNVPESPLLGDSNSREIFNEMLDSEYVKLMTSHEGMGLSKMLMRQLDANGDHE